MSTQCYSTKTLNTALKFHVQYDSRTLLLYLMSSTTHTVKPYLILSFQHEFFCFFINLDMQWSFRWEVRHSCHDVLVCPWLFVANPSSPKSHPAWKIFWQSSPPMLVLRVGADGWPLCSTPSTGSFVETRNCRWALPLTSDRCLTECG